MARRKLYPLPVQAIIEHPLAIALPGAAFGALMRLCFHVWETECRPLPKDNHSLMQLARAHGPTWRHHKAAILQVFADIEPELRAYHAKRTTDHQTLRIAAHNGGSANAARHRLAAIRDISTPPQPPTTHQTGLIPTHREPDRSPRPRTQPTSKPLMTDSAR